MSTEARVRIESHRLMRETSDPYHEERVHSARAQVEGRKVNESKRLQRRVQVHLGVFLVSFIFTTGFLVLSVLLWVRPDAFLSIVIISTISGLVFVASFSTLRMFILHTLLDEYPNREEDPGTAHHISKSIAYGFIALVFAVLLAGILIKIASASTFL